jgi:hypothetical protein
VRSEETEGVKVRGERRHMRGELSGVGHRCSRRSQCSMQRAPGSSLTSCTACVPVLAVYQCWHSSGVEAEFDERYTVR